MYIFVVFIYHVNSKKSKGFEGIATGARLLFLIARNRNICSAHDIIRLVYNSNIFIERIVEGMSELNQTINELKVYLGEDQEEKNLREKYEQQVGGILHNMRKNFGDNTKNTEWSISTLGDKKRIKIEGNALHFSLNKDKNVIEVEKIVYRLPKILDEIIIQEGELYCTQKREFFTEEIFNQYLKEAFKEILNK
ncbi:DUF3942 family protein [Bacillus thuringiensis]|uniref:DUF3942 family protein n=1 Tax=Bacillus thuringiensis TaxID=1428 RepID=UPI003826A8AE